MSLTFQFLILTSLIALNLTNDLRLFSQNELIKYIQSRKDIFSGPLPETKETLSTVSKILISDSVDPIVLINDEHDKETFGRNVVAKETNNLVQDKSQNQANSQRQSTLWAQSAQKGKVTKYEAKINSSVKIANETQTINADKIVTANVNVKVIRVTLPFKENANDEEDLINEASDLMQNMAGLSSVFGISLSERMNVTLVSFNSSKQTKISYDKVNYEQDLKSSGICIVLGEYRKVVLGRIGTQGRETAPDGLFRSLDSTSSLFTTVILPE